MTVVVTGAAGFIGGHVVDALLGRGEHVVALDRRPLGSLSSAAAGASPFPAGRRSGGSLRFFAADLADVQPADAAGTALIDADAVIALAGCGGVRDTGADIAVRRTRDNVESVRRTLALVRPGVPVVVASSSSVYGGSRSGRASRETAALVPRGGYAASKSAAEAVCRTFREQGRSVTVVRPFTVAGENQRSDMALSRWIAAAAAGLPLTVYGSMERTRDVTDVRAVARCLLALLDRDPATTVNIGTGVGHTLRTLTAAVGRAVGTPVTVQLHPCHPDDVSDTLADTTRLERLVGFRPVTDLDELLVRQATAQLEGAAPAGEQDPNRPAEHEPAGTAVA